MSRATIPADIRQVRTRYGFNSSNVLTLTNPKVLKSEIVAPTAVLHLAPKYRGSCPAAGSCASLCLNTAGNPAYLKGKLLRRRLRSDAFADHPAAFTRLLVLEVCRFVSKLWKLQPVIGLRLNGTSDFLWERVPVEICQDLADYCQAQFGLSLPVGRFSSLLEPLVAAIPNLRPYDYTKRTDRDWQAAARLGYHLTLSHGSTSDTFSTAVSQGLNYAAAIDLPRGAALPETVRINGEQFATLDGDTTDWRPGDASGQTHVVLLRIKRTPGQTEEQRRAFCIA
jgi:hypothetical protein